MNNDDFNYLKSELDRLEGRTLDFGFFAGWTVDAVRRVDRGYLLWCLSAVPLRPALQKAILRELSRRSHDRHGRGPRRFVNGKYASGSRQGNCGVRT